MRASLSLIVLTLAAATIGVGWADEPVFRGVQGKQTIIDAWQEDEEESVQMRGAGGKSNATPETGVPLSFLIVFQYNSASLTETARRQLDAIAEAMKSNQLAGSRFTIEGHTDVSGSDAYNLELSIRRAKSVLLYLVSVHGIDPSTLTAVGVGEQGLYNPADPTAEENRRVRIIRFAS
jgi:Outer membrane protein and related peptidoglycan-associated (lipo)proteins